MCPYKLIFCTKTTVDLYKKQTNYFCCCKKFRVTRSHRQWPDNPKADTCSPSGKSSMNHFPVNTTSPAWNSIRYTQWFGSWVCTNTNSTACLKKKKQHNHFGKKPKPRTHIPSIEGKSYLQHKSISDAYFKMTGDRNSRLQQTMRYSNTCLLCSAYIHPPSLWGKEAQMP